MQQPHFTDMLGCCTPGSSTLVGQQMANLATHANPNGDCNSWSQHLQLLESHNCNDFPS
jgi:hypothetical protein